MVSYVGEHLWPKQIGHIFIILSFVAALMSAFAFFLATQRRKLPEFSGWRTIGRISFGVHGLSIFTVIGTIFYIMTQKWYEYQYVQQHVNDELAFRYVFSAFWEGQEGSFLLWMFWHVILGFVLIFRGKNWETSVLATLALIQVLIGSMLLGIYFGSVKIGSNPLLLLRDVMNIPLFNKPDYVGLLKGNGLNPLLQNYWMTIHPPTLFLGFASTSIPFCYAVAGLWLRKHKEWLTAVQPWGLFSGAILGLGILMGAAWAYEALSFGGYWAWDPVENMSLVPWLIMIAGIHTNLISKVTGYAIKSSYLFYLLSFLLILYSTFLTRSGVLGESSVHAFTEMGLEWQLVGLLGLFTALGFGLYFARQSKIPIPEKEESISSKEFWMYIGTLVLLFSSVLITFTTSIPVYNKIGKAFGYDLNWAAPLDAVAHYNKYQLWIGVFMGLLTGFAQYLRFREVNFGALRNRFWKHIGISIGVSAVLTFVASLELNIVSWQYAVLAFAGVYAFVANLDYLISFLKGNLKIGSSSISHLGFGLMLLGILFSGLNKQFISTNRFAQEGLIEGFSNEDYGKNIILLKGKPMPMNGYEVTYLKDTVDGHDRNYLVNYKKIDSLGNTTGETFTLTPNVLYDKDYSRIAAYNPSTKHYLHKDIFTLISALPASEQSLELAQKMEDSLQYKPFEVKLHDTISGSNFVATVDRIDYAPTHPDYKPEPKDLTIGLTITYRKKETDETFVVHPMILLRAERVYFFPAQTTELAIKTRVPDRAIVKLMQLDKDLTYSTFEMKEGDKVDFNGKIVEFSGFNKTPTHPNYQAVKDDIAVGAVINVIEGDTALSAEPLFVIRDGQTMNLKDEIRPLGLHFRFVKVDPVKQSITLMAAYQDPGQIVWPLEVAENVPRTDFIVLQAIVFPGINLFWLGSLMMLLGLALAMLHRRRTMYKPS